VLSPFNVPRQHSVSISLISHTRRMPHRRHAALHN
jgi:hypothetical protein